MKIKLRDIPSSGLPFEETVLPRDLGLFEEFINPSAPVVISGQFDRAGDVVLAKLKVVFTIEDNCARCLEHISRRVNFDYDFDFEIEPGDEYIDVGDRIREEVILGHMPRMLCREDCKGLCPGCGAELNTEECECEKKGKK